MRDHYMAMKAQLQLDPVLKVSDAARMTGNPPTLAREQYLILYGSTGSLDNDRHTAPQAPNSDATFRYTIRAVSISADGVLLLMTKVYAQLAGRILTITGRKCNPILLDNNNANVEPDMSVVPPLFYLDIDAELKSSRA
jgi:hypothetical protein